MRETSKLPTDAPLAPSHRPSFHCRSRRTHPRHSSAVRGAPTHVIPAPTHVIPAKAGIHPDASTLPKRQPLPPSTEFYRILQNPTEIRVCARAHAREVSLPSFRHSREGGALITPVIPAKAGALITPSFPRRQAHPPPTSFPRRQAPPRHSHTLPRHSREGGNPFLSTWIPPRPQRIGDIA